MTDLPTQINLARFTEAARGKLGTWAQLDLARAMVLPPALDTALSSLSGNPAALVGVVRTAKHCGPGAAQLQARLEFIKPTPFRLWGAGAFCRAW